MRAERFNLDAPRGGVPSPAGTGSGLLGSRGLSPVPGPLGTVHATFTAHGSSISKRQPL